MAHPEQRAFVELMKQRFPSYFRYSKNFVVEFGSLNVNGTIRDLFDTENYIGVDCVDGPGVDHVCLAHEYADPDGSFDAVICCEMLEHDPHAQKSIANMVRLLAPGGIIILTIAAPGRPEHGTKRTGEVYGPDPDYYQPIDCATLYAWLGGGKMFEKVECVTSESPADTYFYGIKKMEA